MSDPEFILLGDALWLDFVNTAVTPPGPRDLLPDPAAYHRWTKAGKLISDVELLPLEEILGFRGRLLALAEALDAGRQPPASSIQAINDVLARTAGHERLTRIKGTWRTQFTPDRQLTALDAIARSVAQTLSNPIVTVRRCAGDTCTLYFADASTTKSRRWCSMSTCGRRVRIDRRKGTRITPVG